MNRMFNLFVVSCIAAIGLSAPLPAPAETISENQDLRGNVDINGYLHTKGPNVLAGATDIEALTADSLDAGTGAVVAASSTISGLDTVGRLSTTGSVTAGSGTISGALSGGSLSSTGTATLASIVNGGTSNGPSLAGFRQIPAATSIVGTNAPAATNAAIYVSVVISNRVHYLLAIPANQ